MNQLHININTKRIVAEGIVSFGDLSMERILFCLLIVTGASSGKYFRGKNHDFLHSDDLNKGRDNAINGSDKLNGFLAQFLTYFDDDSTCKLDSALIIREASELNVAALKLIDASAKLPSGILSGNLNQYGDFDECVQISFDFGSNLIKGKYCLATLSIEFKGIKNENIRMIDNFLHSHRSFTNEIDDAGHRIPKLETFNWGVCIPDSCNHDDLEKASKKFIDRNIDLNEIEINVRVNEKMCFRENEKEFTFPKNAALLFFAWMIFLAISATLVDFYAFENTNFIRYLKCFSMKRNLKELFKTDTSDDEIMPLHGARFLNAVSLLLSHKQMALMFNPIMNRTEMAESLGKPWSMIGRSAILYTDSFILISGLLTSYSIIKELDDKGRINFRKRFINRLIRFTPSLFALIIFCTYIIEDLGSGPQWALVINQYADLCKKNMWQNFLYIHNYFGFENMCLTHTHQLGIDMQLFLVSPILIYALWKNFKKGFLLIFGLGTASTCLRYYITVREQLSTLIYYGISVERLWRTASLSYILPTHRLTVYVSGIALGYFLRRNGRNLSMNYFSICFGWIFAFIAGLSAMFGPYQSSSKDYSYTVIDSALYNAFSPILWLIFLSWCIIACENGWGGWFNKFLSWKYFTVFTRISYAIYLIQFPVYFYGVGTQRSPIFYKGFHSLIDLPEFGLILFLSVGMTLLFDLPFQDLRKTYLDGTNSENKKIFFSKKIKSHGN